MCFVLFLAICFGRTGIGQRSSWRAIPMAATLYPWSTPRWGGPMASLLIMSKNSSNLQELSVWFSRGQCVSSLAFLVFNQSLMLPNRMHRLYWVDSQLDLVGHIDFQGNDRQSFTSIGEITQPFSLTVYKGGIGHFLISVLNNNKLIIIVINCGSNFPIH